MKKTLLLLMIAGAFYTANAQPGGPRMTVAERVANAHTKIDSAFKLEPAKLVQVDSAYSTYFRATDALREEMRAGGERPDFQVMRAKMEPITAAKDKTLQGIFTAEQFDKYKKEVEPLLMPRRGGGNGGGGNGGGRRQD